MAENYSRKIRIHMSFDVEGNKLPKFSLLNEQLVLISLIRTAKKSHICVMTLICKIDGSHFLIIHWKPTWSLKL